MRRIPYFRIVIVSMAAGLALFSLTSAQQSPAQQVSLIRLRVSVLDAFQRPVENLLPAAFHITDARQQAHLAHFERDADPMSVVFLVDKSASMSVYDSALPAAATAFARASAPGTEFSVISVNDEPQTILGPTDDVNALDSAIRSVKARGNSALLDGICAAVAVLHAVNDRKLVVLVISDGQLFKSHKTMSDVSTLLKQTDVEVFAIKIMRGGGMSFDELNEPAFLSDICRLSGGRVMSVLGSKYLPDVADRLAREIGKQYVLGFQPASVTPGWHAITVRIDSPPKQPPYHCIFRSGYTFPQQTHN